MIDLYDSELFVHYGFFSLRSPDAVVGDLGEARAGQANGLCGANLPGQVWCTTGLHTGDIPLRVEWLPASPPVDPQWEDVVEASAHFSARRLILAAFQDGASLDLPQTGPHRVRYCASAMDAGHEMDTPEEDETAPDRNNVR